MRKLPLESLDAFFQAVEERKSLYLPADGSSGASWRRYQPGLTLSKAGNTLRSAKDFFFPQSETFAKFRFEEMRIDVEDARVESEDFVIFGVRPCDVASFAILDSVFLEEPVDTCYKNRRDHSLVISLACTNVRSTCFCSLYGIDATKGGADIDCIQCDDGYYFVSNNEKGEAFLSCLDSLFLEGDPAVVEKKKSEIRERLEKLPYGKLSLKKFGKDSDLLALFNSEKWEKLSQSCLGCGTCTFVCPTCQCFDIRDFDAGRDVHRYRCWDSCMYSDFTQMAAENPRHTQKERFRQRFMHKLVYFPKEHGGTYGCVGCGRCLEKCPIHMHIVKVIKALEEEA